MRSSHHEHDTPPRLHLPLCCLCCPAPSTLGIPCPQRNAELCLQDYCAMRAHHVAELGSCPPFRDTLPSAKAMNLPIWPSDPTLYSAPAALAINWSPAHSYPWTFAQAVPSAFHCLSSGFHVDPPEVTPCAHNPQRPQHTTWGRYCCNNHCLRFKCSCKHAYVWLHVGRKTTVLHFPGACIEAWQEQTLRRHLWRGPV